jgi:hypothetical protein
VQLANRMGALNNIEFSEFVVKTQAFADAVGGTPSFSDMLEEVAVHVNWISLRACTMHS